MKKLVLICAILAVLLTSSALQASWETFAIRNASGTNNPPTVTENVTASDSTTGWTSFGITESGQKAGWGTSSMDGQTVGDLQAVSITRHSSVDGWGPYFNIWISDGQGGYATLANEPSHTSEYSNYGETAYDMTWEGALENATCWVYEVDSSQGFLLPNGQTTYSNLPAGTTNPFTFGDFANYTIEVSTSHWGGSGAADDLNASTYTAYGFNWVFGDTQDNYTDSYLVKDATVVPEPTTIAILGMGAVGLIRRKRNA